MGLIKSIKEFLSEKFNLYLVLFLILLGTIAYFKDFDLSKKSVSEEIEIHFFYLPTCPHCNEQKPIYYAIKEEFNQLENKNIKFFEHDASTSEGSSLFYKMASEAGLDTKRLAVPTIFVNNRFGKNALIGVQSKENLLNAINQCVNQCKNEQYQNKPSQNLTDENSIKNFDLPFLGKTDLTKYSLLSLSIILGLIDGFNPCAMWVLVYLIGILIGLNDKKKIWIIVGSFVFASGVLYFLFMTAWLNVFLLLGYMKLITIIIGMIALGGGILSLKEYITTKGELVCKVGDVNDHKKTMKKIDKIALQPITIGVVISIIGLAFVVNSVEFMCSAAIPAVFTQILALSNISTLMNYLYIAIYTFFFMLDDLVVFGMAAFAVNNSFGDKYAKYCKLIGGIIMTVLGFILLFAPQLLR
ncbi:MAG: hypothetical protein QXE31_04515 [Candidatus Woesearchaeota archaeon]